MFKIEIQTSTGIKHRYFMNKHEDEFIKFLPNIFTRDYGEIISKDSITVFAIEENNFHLYEGVRNQHPSNKGCWEYGKSCESGKLKIIRYDGARFNSGDWVKKDEFLMIKKTREDIFQGSKSQQLVIIPNEVVHDFGEGEVPAYKLNPSCELCSSHTSVELGLSGRKIKKDNRHNKNGKFLGNKYEEIKS